MRAGLVSAAISLAGLLCALLVEAQGLPPVKPASSEVKLRARSQTSLHTGPLAVRQLAPRHTRHSTAARRSLAPGASPASTTTISSSSSSGPSRDASNIFTTLPRTATASEPATASNSSSSSDVPNPAGNAAASSTPAPSVLPRRTLAPGAAGVIISPAAATTTRSASAAKAASVTVVWTRPGTTASGVSDAPANAPGTAPIAKSAAVIEVPNKSSALKSEQIVPSKNLPPKVEEIVPFFKVAKAVPGSSKSEKGEAPRPAAPAPSPGVQDRPSLAKLLVTPEDEFEQDKAATEPQCKLPAIPLKRDLGVIMPPLPSGKRPNIIMILADDLGWDDIAMHHPKVESNGRPRYLQTPNIDRLVRMSKEFRNFYVTPMCSQSRAELLTGRDYARTGTLLINGGYDYIDRAEVNIGDAMKRLGYATSHFGKWHNGRTLGYEPWNTGFDESWLPTAHLHMDNVFRHNGDYVPTKGLMEQRLMDKILEYLDDQKDSSKPFFMYYAPHAPHAGFMHFGKGPRWARPAPPEFQDKYYAYKGIIRDTAQVFAMTEYLDSVLGRLFDYLLNNDLLENTYLFFTGDNGSELFPGERVMPARQIRMPSQMVGFKKDITEGGNRHFLLVAGPGIAAGSTDHNLTSVKDLMATAVALGGGDPASVAGWRPDGLSMADLLTPSGVPSEAREERMLFQLKPDCLWSDLVAELGPDRRVVRPQPLLDYKVGGKDGQGFQRCIGVRWGRYKWNGDNPTRIYYISGNNHIEGDCNIYTASDVQAQIAKAKAAAAAWWEDLVAEPHSFHKPTFYLGFEGQTETNVLVDGAFDRPAGRVVVEPSGASGFSRVGDYVGFKVQVDKRGYYTIGVLYSSSQECTVKLSVGTYADIMEEEAPSLTFKLAKQVNKTFVNVGGMNLELTEGSTHDEIRLEVLRMSDPGEAIFTSLEVIRFSWRPRPVPTPTPANAGPNVNAVTKSTVVLGTSKESVGVPYESEQLPFKSPLVHEQAKFTPAWVTNPSYFDPCETEGVWHKAHECGLPYSYFMD